LDNNIIIDVKEVGYVLDFSLTYLLLASTWGLGPPHPFSTQTCSLLPIGAGYFWAKPFPT